MQPVVGVGVRACQSLIEEQWKAEFVGERRGVRQRVIRFYAPVHLRPITHVPRFCTYGGVVKLANAHEPSCHRTSWQETERSGESGNGDDHQSKIVLRTAAGEAGNCLQDAISQLLRSAAARL